MTPTSEHSVRAFLALRVRPAGRDARRHLVQRRRHPLGDVLPGRLPAAGQGADLRPRPLPVGGLRRELPRRRTGDLLRQGAAGDGVQRRRPVGAREPGGGAPAPEPELSRPGRRRPRLAPREPAVRVDPEPRAAAPRRVRVRTADRRAPARRLPRPGQARRDVVSAPPGSSSRSACASRAPSSPSATRASTTSSARASGAEPGCRASGWSCGCWAARRARRSCCSRCRCSSTS